MENDSTLDRTPESPVASSSFRVRAALLFALLVAANYWPIFQGRIPFPKDVVLNFPPWQGWRGGKATTSSHAEMGDVVTQIYPWRSLAAEAVQKGTLPLWNPYILSGTPFLADAQSALFYPLNFFYYVSPRPWAWTIRLLLTIVLAGLFTTLLVRAIGGSTIGSLAAGLIFAFSAFLTVWQAFPMADSAIWLPLVLLAVDQLRRFPRPSSVVLGGVAFAMPVLAGHPETAAHVTLVGVAFAICRCASPPDVCVSGDSGRIRYLALFFVAGLLALALAAVQILPTLEWLGQIGHGLHLKWGARPVHEILAFFSRDIVHSQDFANIAVPEGAAYVGMLTLLAASLAPLHRNRHDVVFFGLLLAVALPIVYGWGPLYWLSQNLPVIGGLKNYRLLLAVDFALAVLAGFGISALGEQSLQQLLKGRRLLWLILPAATLGCSSAAIWMFQSYTHNWLWSRSPSSSLILLLASVVLVAWRLFWRLRQAKFYAMAIVLLGVDLLSFSHHYSPFASPDEIFPPAPVFQFLRARAGSNYRVASLNDCYGTNFEMMYGLFSVSGYDISLRRTKNLLRDMSEDQLDAITLTAQGVAAFPDRRLDFLNLKYLVACYQAAEILRRMPDRFSPVFSDGPLQVFENRSVLPRAFLVPASGIEVFSGEMAQLARLRQASFDPENSVVLPEEPDFGKARGRIENQSAHGSTVDRGRAFEVDHQINKVRLRAVVTQPSVLILSQIHYPGWKVFVNGGERPLLRPDYALQGVALLAGTYEIRFIYDPLSFRVGLWISVVALLLVVGLVALEAPRGRRA